MLYTFRHPCLCVFTTFMTNLYCHVMFLYLYCLHNFRYGFEHCWGSMGLSLGIFKGTAKEISLPTTTSCKCRA